MDYFESKILSNKGDMVYKPLFGAYVKLDRSEKIIDLLHHVDDIKTIVEDYKKRNDKGTYYFDLQSKDIVDKQNTEDRKNGRIEKQQQC